MECVQHLRSVNPLPLLKRDIKYITVHKLVPYMFDKLVNNYLKKMCVCILTKFHLKKQQQQQKQSFILSQSKCSNRVIVFALSLLSLQIYLY